VDFTRRSLILGTAGVAAAGAGVTAAAGGLQGSVEGQADVQAEQALTVNDVDVRGTDVDASFTRTSDDNTEFQAAVELNNGDLAVFEAEVINSAADGLDVQVTIDAPDPIDTDVVSGKSSASGGGDVSAPGDLDPDDNGVSGASPGGGKAVQTGEGTFIANITSNGSGTRKHNIGIIAELDDTADAGPYDIGVAINPLSTN
jgi:hypothetical protein